MAAHPRVAIGLPVRNGEHYLSETARSLLTQTCDDFELLIADNASTDATPDICRELARSDARVRYVRHRENIGAAPNFNYVFRHTRGEYFKWAAHDDLCAPEFLARCVQGLDADPGVVLCHTYSVWVDPLGAVIGQALGSSGVTGPSPALRFIAALRFGYPVVVWGVMRRDAVGATGLLESFVGSDRYFLAELLLRGRAALVPEYLFAVRQHEQSFSDSFYRQSQRDRRRWFDPRMRLAGLTGMAAVTARLARRLAAGPLPLRDRAVCAAYVGRRFGGFVKHRAAETAAEALRNFGSAPAAMPPEGPAGSPSVARTQTDPRRQPRGDPREAAPSPPGAP